MTAGRHWSNEATKAYSYPEFAWLAGAGWVAVDIGSSRIGYSPPRSEATRRCGRSPAA
jgi:hypothetical protein